MNAARVCVVVRHSFRVSPFSFRTALEELATLPVPSKSTIVRSFFSLVVGLISQASRAASGRGQCSDAVGLAVRRQQQ
eukprot:4643914-Lingulodinium_polyedra.AAC.1